MRVWRGRLAAARCSTVVGTSARAVSDDALVAALKQEVQLLRKQLAGRDAAIRRLQRVDDHVCDSNGLLEALTRNTERIVLAGGVTLDLGQHTLSDGASCEIIGNGSTIVGNFRVLDGSRFVATELTVASSDPQLPCVEVSGIQSAVHFDGCTLKDGRDGLYMSGGTSAHLGRCALIRNARGVFEGFRCSLTALDCVFDANLFHLVLLRQPGDVSRVKSVYGCGHSFSGPPGPSRGDVALRYNPVTDVYGEVYRDGHVEVLTPAESTANLVESAW